MHGAMYVKGISDPEGFFIKKIRSKVSKNCKISLSYDLHGQMTDSIIKNIDYFAAYKTAPHIDVKQTYSRSLKMLIDGILKNKKNHIIWEKIPVLVSGEMSSTIVFETGLNKIKLGAFVYSDPPLNTSTDSIISRLSILTTEGINASGLKVLSEEYS